MHYLLHWDQYSSLSRPTYFLYYCKESATHLLLVDAIYSWGLYIDGVLQSNL